MADDVQSHDDKQQHQNRVLLQMTSHVLQPNTQKPVSAKLTELTINLRKLIIVQAARLLLAPFQLVQQETLNVS